MPSAGVSDGVQSAIAERYPGTIFCPVETSGDGRVNFYSRVQMYLFKAKQAAVAEYERALEEHGVTREQVQAFLATNARFASPLHRAPHAYAGTCADLVAEVAPHITRTRWERLRARVTGTALRSRELAQKSPHLVVKMVQGAIESAPEVAARVKQDVAAFQEDRKAKRAQRRSASASASAASAAPA
jgi:hypothetical protein